MKDELDIGNCSQQSFGVVFRPKITVIATVHAIGSGKRLSVSRSLTLAYYRPYDLSFSGSQMVFSPADLPVYIREFLYPGFTYVFLVGPALKVTT